MQKIQVFLREDQKAALKALSARTGTRQSDLVRQGVDLLLRTTAERNESWREATRMAFGMWRDRSDIDALSKGFRARAKARFASLYEGK